MAGEHSLGNNPVYISNMMHIGTIWDIALPVVLIGRIQSIKVRLTVDHNMVVITMPQQKAIPTICGTHYMCRKPNSIREKFKSPIRPL